MRNYAFPLLFILLSALTFTGCDKDDDPVNEPTHEDMLVADVWRGDQLLIDGVNVTSLPLVKNEVLDMPTLRIDFNRDKTYVATYRRGEDDIEERGSWQLKNDGQILELDFLGDTEVLRLTERNLDLTATLIDEENETFEAEMRLVR